MDIADPGDSNVCGIQRDHLESWEFQKGKSALLSSTQTVFHQIIIMIITIIIVIITIIIIIIISLLRYSGGIVN